MDNDGDTAAVGSRHLVAATDSWQIIDDEVETAIGLHARALLPTLSAQSATSSRSVARIHVTSRASATTR
jgi:hypothetical protein